MSNTQEFVLMEKAQRDSIVTFLAGLSVVPLQTQAEAEVVADAKEEKPTRKPAKNKNNGY